MMEYGIPITPFDPPMLLILDRPNRQCTPATAKSQEAKQSAFASVMVVEFLIFRHLNATDHIQSVKAQSDANIVQTVVLSNDDIIKTITNTNIETALHGNTALRT